MTDIRATETDAARARLLLIVLCLGWGITWATMRISLTEIPPFACGWEHSFSAPPR